METLILHAPENAKMTPEQKEAGSVFLAGTIEMGAGEDWQPKAIKALTGKAGAIYNPRRKDWDSNLKQSISDPVFSEQVNWELDHIARPVVERKRHVVYFYFDPDSKSPITLLELGLVCGMLENPEAAPHVIVCCPPGFWRRGNIEIVCARHKIPLYADFDESIGAVLTVLRLVEKV
jgi:hypothetical protein